MGQSAPVCDQTNMLVIWICALLAGVLAEDSNNSTKTGRTFSLFSIVQFPNEVCTSSSSTTTYGTSYTSSTTGSCAYTINKVQDDICQLRLDFQSFSGLATSTTAGTCTDYLTVAGQTGKNPPSICGTNTDYHMYAEFGATSTDTATVTFTYGSTTTAKTFNILLRQISCTATWRAPTDCTQYFTGAA